MQTRLTKLATQKLLQKNGKILFKRYFSESDQRETSRRSKTHDATSPRDGSKPTEIRVPFRNCCSRLETCAKGPLEELSASYSLLLSLGLKRTS
jgi:hypothetical protein